VRESHPRDRADCRRCGGPRRADHGLVQAARHEGGSPSDQARGHLHVGDRGRGFARCEHTEPGGACERNSAAERGAGPVVGGQLEAGEGEGAENVEPASASDDRWPPAPDPLTTATPEPLSTNGTAARSTAKSKRRAPVKARLTAFARGATSNAQNNGCGPLIGSVSFEPVERPLRFQNGQSPFSKPLELTPDPILGPQPKRVSFVRLRLAALRPTLESASLPLGQSQDTSYKPAYDGKG